MGCLEILYHFQCVTFWSQSLLTDRYTNWVSQKSSKPTGSKLIEPVSSDCPVYNAHCSRKHPRFRFYSFAVRLLLMYICMTSRLPQARVCIFVAPASSALQRALARNSHALAGLLQTLYLVKETHSSTCADGWRQGDDVTARRQMCGARWPAPANAFYPWPWGASDVPPLPLNVVSNAIKFRERLWRPGGRVNILAHVKAVKIQCLHSYVCSLAMM